MLLFVCAACAFAVVLLVLGSSLGGIGLLVALAVFAWVLHFAADQPHQHQRDPKGGCP